MGADDAGALSERALALRDEGRLEEALEAIERSIALDPGNATHHNRRGTICRLLWRPEEAIASFHRASQLSPGYAAPMGNLGNLLQELGEDVQARHIYEHALRINPRDANVHWNYSLVLLRLGHFDLGWREYEWRKKILWKGVNLREYPGRPWRPGEPVTGRTVLVRAEQGLGDTIQFCRYLPWLAWLGARVVAEVPESLMPLLRTLPVDVQWIRETDPVPPIDLHAFMLSLPLAAHMRKHALALETGYLAADHQRVKAWRERLAAWPRPWIGVAWSGSTLHAGDAQRSIPAETLFPALPRGPRYISLQKDVRGRDEAALRSRDDVVDVRHLLTDFGETAALCDVLDAVVTVDTSVAHLAGALGKPVELLLPFSADWRWGRGSDRTHWYPTMRLWRQAARGDWGPVLARVSGALGSAR